MTVIIYEKNQQSKNYFINLAKKKKHTHIKILIKKENKTLNFKWLLQALDKNVEIIGLKNK